MSKLRQAVALYQGEFLVGFTVKEAFVFEECVHTEREHIRYQVMEGLELLVADAIRWEDWTSGVDYAHRLLTLEPWRESTHRQLMILHNRAGRREAAVEQFERCKKILAEELAVEPSAETVAFFERLQATRVAPPHNLPPQPNAFLGRVEELEQIHENLNDVNCRLLTVAGSGGIGKTRLAIEAGRRYTDSTRSLSGTIFSDGVYFVPFASIQGGYELDADACIAAIAEAVGTSFHGQTDLQDHLNRFLQPKSLLLICDNIEHLLSSASGSSASHTPILRTLQSILREAPDVKLLVTSRQRLNLQVERVLTVEGLTYPETARHDLKKDALEAYSAVALFLRRVEQAQPDYVLSETSVLAVAKLCRLLEGMPLGLELAAHWVRYLSIDDIVEELERGLDILTTSTHNIPARHRSMRAVFDYSWQRLSSKEQSTLSKLSVFQGGFTPETATDITEASMGTLVALSDQSLIRRVEGDRYEMHELLRQFAAEKLTNMGGEREAQTQHGQYYLALLAENEEGLFGEKPKQVLQMLSREIGNIRKAWQWATANHRWSSLINGMDGLAKFYEISGFFQEGEHLFAQTADSLNSNQPELNAIRCRLQIGQASMLFAQGLLGQAVEVAREAVDLTNSLVSSQKNRTTSDWAQSSHLELEGRARFELGRSLHKQGEQSAAPTQFERALTLARAVQNRHLEADILRHWCWNSYDQGDFNRAIELQSAAEELFRQLGDRLGIGITQFDSAFIAFFKGDIRTAGRKFEAALADFRQVGDRRFESFSVFNLGICARGGGKYTKSLTLLHEAISLAQANGDQDSEINGLVTAGKILSEIGDYDAAADYLQQASEMNRVLGGRVNLARWCRATAYLYHCQDRQMDALRRLEEGLGIVREMDNYELEIEMLPLLGRVHSALSNHKAAQEIYEQAAKMLEQSEDHRVIEPLAGLAQLHQNAGETEQAMEKVNTVLETIARDGLIGVTEPFLVYLICHQVLEANGDSRATEVLFTGHQLLQNSAGFIEDEGQRRSFFEDVTTNRELDRLVHLKLEDSKQPIAFR
ncbi:tetratricopeptide repeat protein [Chloroflexi bacterium TSY]|nr:tetratricopeptide repeat protein [Chloroflexi bacterium TSY]